MKMVKLMALLLVFTIGFSIFTACGNPDSNQAAVNPANPAETTQGGGSTKDTVIYRVGGDPLSFNPSLLSDDNLYNAAQNMFHRLTKLDTTKSPIPDAAQSWEISEDALTITWHLRDGLKWWDGEALNAEDVKYTFDYIKEHPECYFSTSMQIVDSIEIVDDLTVVFHMNTPDMSFIARLGWYATFILPEHIFNNGQAWGDNPASKNPVGSGPFKFESYTQGSNITLVANEDYIDGPPKIKKLIYSIIPDDATAIQALLNGELDGMEGVPNAYVDQFLNDKNFRMVLDPYPSPYRIVFNMKAEKVKDLAVRKAIALCIDREEIASKVYGNVMTPEYSAYPAVVSWCANTTDTYPKQNIEEAKKVLKDAGYTKDASGYYVTGITWDVFEGMQDMANLIIASCKEAGIGIEMILSEYNAWSQKVGPGGNFMMESQGGFMGPDPAALATRYGTGSGSNYSGWSNAEFDSLCAQAAATSEKEERAELYKQAQKIIVDELPAINVIGYAAYKVYPSNLVNVPEDGAGKWGWAEWSNAFYQ